MRPTVFDVVADPNRRQILDLLREDEHSVSQLVAALSVSQPAVSKHLRESSGPTMLGPTPATASPMAARGPC